MRKFELSVSPDYVPTWNVVDGVRELFQNSLDQQTTCPDNEMFFNYEPHTEILTIGNKNSILEPKTLLLGSTTKKDDNSTIGKFGEGYKLATLVLLRLGKSITFYNYGRREVWTPRFVDSRRYGTKVLTFFVDHKYMWQSVPNSNLKIVVDGITNEEYEDIVASNLHLQTLEDTIETPFGTIIKDRSCKGKVFVNGLYVCTHEPYVYGYNFKPEYINIDRDRKLVSDFDLKWLSSRMWATAKSEDVVNLASNGAADVAFVTNVGYRTSDMYDNAFNTFKLEYGEKAIPVTSQMELSSIPSGYNPIIVHNTYKELITGSTHYEVPVEEERISPIDELVKWFEVIRPGMLSQDVETFHAIVHRLRTTYE